MRPMVQRGQMDDELTVAQIISGEVNTKCVAYKV